MRSWSNPGERRFFTTAAILAAIIVFAGFARTYYLKGAFGTPALSTLVHLHGLVMTLWFTLFVVQAWLISAGRVQWHRRLGYAGAVLAALVVVVGVVTALNAARLGVSPGPPPLVFLAIPLGDMVVFSILVAFGVAYRRRSDIHKRLMVLASVSILTAAIARIPIDWITAGGLPMFFGLTDVCILACIAIDTARNRRLHPAFVGGALLILASQGARFAAAGTPQWQQFAAWLVSLLP